jgi:hypothetical protein
MSAGGQVPARTGQSLTLLHQDHPSKAIVRVPEVNRRDAALVIQLAVDIKRLIGLDLQLADAFTRNGTLASTLTTTCANTARTTFVKRGIKLVAPWRTVRITVAIVVADQIVAAGFLASFDGKWLVDGR